MLITDNWYLRLKIRLSFNTKTRFYSIFFNSTYFEFIYVTVYRLSFYFQIRWNVPPPNNWIFTQFWALVAGGLCGFCHKVSFITTVCLSICRPFSFINNDCKVYNEYYLSLTSFAFINFQKNIYFYQSVFMLCPSNEYIERVK